MPFFLAEIRGNLKPRKSIASLSLDLDNKWSYMKIHGDPGWATFPSCFDVVVPRVLSFLKERGLTITFLIVGQDAALEKNHASLKAIAAAGHEIGNHSFHHEPWLLRSSSEEQIEIEFARAEEAIEHATGQHPVGFRGPGYACSEAILRVLVRRGYLYDASTLPSLIGPLAGIYYVMSTRLSPEEKRKRRQIYGSIRDGLRSLRPYRWQITSKKFDDSRDPGRLGPPLIEIPVTTMPILKIPIHLSYILYLSKFSPALALTYFRVALWLCRLTRIQPSLLLHSLDFLGCDDFEDLSFFPGMTLTSEKKIQVISQVLRLLSDQFVVLTLQQHACEIAQTSDLRHVAPDFGPA